MGGRVLPEWVESWGWGVVDPYFSGLLRGGSDVFRWADVSQVGALRGLVGVRGVGSVPDGEAAWGRILGVRRADALGVVGALGSWRTLLAGQVGAFAGLMPGRRLDGLLLDLFAAGVVELGVYSTWLAETDRLVGVRLAPGGGWRSRLFRELGPVERWCVSGGGNLGVGGQYSRHNVLMAELSLRAAAGFEGVVPVGEGSALLGHVGGDLSRRADAVWGLPGDRVVFVEMTASAAPSLGAKVGRWLDLLGRRGGLAVVFVEAFGERAGFGGRGVGWHVERLARGEFSGGWHAGAFERLWVVGWEDWFGADGGVLGGFRAGLVARRFDPVRGAWVSGSLVGGGGSGVVEGRSGWLGSCLGSPVWARGGGVGGGLLECAVGGVWRDLAGGCGGGGGVPWGLRPWGLPGRLASRGLGG